MRTYFAQQKHQNTREQKKTALIGAAFCLALSALSLLLFRGPVSLISAFFIPASILVFSINQGKVYYSLTTSGLLLLAIFFFMPQTFFVLGYILLAILFRILFLKTGQSFLSNKLKVLVALLSTSFILFLGIRLTQWVFLIPLHTMMVGISKGNPFIYGGILLLEGFLVLSINLAFLSLLNRRLSSLSFFR